MLCSGSRRRASTTCARSRRLSPAACPSRRSAWSPGVKLVLATRNAHKLREFEGMLRGHEIVPLPEEVELPAETGETFEENAEIKARAAAAATGLPAIADDSGIAAAALGGAPGVR